MKKYFLPAIIFCSLFVLVRCGNNSQPESTNKTVTPTAEDKTNLADKGIGPYKEIKLSPSVDPEMATQGMFIFKTRCVACHKLSSEKLVGPGWKRITKRRAPEWIMNYITNTDVMLDKNLIAKKLLAECGVRMPNQFLSPEDARNILEFMRKND